MNKADKHKGMCLLSETETSVVSIANVLYTFTLLVRSLDVVLNGVLEKTKLLSRISSPALPPFS